MDKDIVVGIPESIYSNIAHMFGMYDFFEIQKYLLNWFKKHMGLDLVAVETFSRGNDEYFY